MVLRKVILIGNHSSPYVLLGTPVSSLPGRKSIAVHFEVLSLAVALIEIRTSAVLILRRAIEVVEHQVHVLSLFPLEMILYVFIPVNFYFNVSICLSRKSSWLCESIVVDLLVGRILNCASSRSHVMLHYEVHVLVADIERLPAASLSSASCPWRLSLRLDHIAIVAVACHDVVLSSFYPAVRVEPLLILNEVRTF